MPSTVVHPPTPPRKRLTSYDPELISKQLLSSTNSMQQQKSSGHRKSSIPFADRSPKVRFLRQVEPHGEDDHGTHQPIIVVEKYEDNFKPILKHTDFPILVDMKSLESGIPRNYQSTNEELEGCINSVEQVLQYFSKAEREARGAVDILTFPVASGSVEPLSRFEGSMVVAILAVEKLPQVFQNDDKGYTMDIVKLTDDLLNDIKKAKQSAKNLLKKASRRHKEWSKLLSRKGEFKVEHQVSKVPIYSKNTMPECVTLYEDVFDENMRYKFEGTTRIYRQNKNIILSTDIRENVYTKYPEEIDEEQLYIITETVMVHAKDLIFYASNNLDVALTTLHEEAFDVGFAGVRDRIVNIEFDAFFDPLCALELKNSLGDVVARKGELINVVEHIVFYLEEMKKFTKKFRKFCKQIAQEQKTKQSSKGECCGIIKPMTVDKLLTYLPGIGVKDFMISIPLTEKFQRVIFSMEPSELKLSVHDRSDTKNNISS